MTRLKAATFSYFASFDLSMKFNFHTVKLRILLGGGTKKRERNAKKHKIVQLRTIVFFFKLNIEAENVEKQGGGE